MSKKYTILVFFQSIRLVIALIFDIFTEYFSIIAIIVDILFLIPVKRRLFLLNIFQVNLSF